MSLHREHRGSESTSAARCCPEALPRAAADIYARCDDANRRLCHQAFFTAIYIEEEGEVRGGYARPFDALTLG